ncbi:hypothetical protein CRYUN_Cryun20dG0046200 [Craigia yunnanensis]
MDATACHSILINPYEGIQRSSYVINKSITRTELSCPTDYRRSLRALPDIVGYCRSLRALPVIEFSCPTGYRRSLRALPDVVEAFVPYRMCHTISAPKGSSHCKWTDFGEIRPHSVTITEFGAVGDGVTLNTKAFQNAIFYLNTFADKGGAKLFVPAGRWLTGSFDLINHLTLWLDKEAVILGSKNSDDWPVVDPLPSYGRGTELPGGRHRSLIYGGNLTDVIITGDNGTIDGHGSVWWNWFRSKTLNYTRPHLVELINATGVVISNLTFLNSPFWTIHPVYCSGWDEYGISFARPNTNIIIRRLTGQNRNGSGIAIGSEMSGGVSEVYAENLYFFDSSTAIIIKTARGRGGYVRNIYISNVTLSNVDTAIKFNSNFSQHPDEFYDPNALPVIERITVKDVIGDNIKVAGLKGIEGDSFQSVCLLNITLNVTSESPWNCSYIEGYSALVSPETYEPLKESIYPRHNSDCYHLSNHLWSSAEVFEEGEMLWKNAVVAQFVGRIPNFNYFQKMFTNSELKDRVLENRPWHIQGKPLIVRKWEPRMRSLEFNMARLPVWLQLVNIPLELFTQKGISYIASALGNSLYSDRITASQKRLAFARVCVEIDASVEIPKSIEVEMRDGNIVQEKVWMPKKVAKEVKISEEENIARSADKNEKQTDKGKAKEEEVSGRENIKRLKSSSVNRFTILDTVLDVEEMVQGRGDDKNLNGFTSRSEFDAVEEENELHTDHGEL